MDDQDLNRLVAEARGWTEITNNDPYGRLVGLIPDGSRADFLPDVASDPAAWGGLYTWLASEGYGVDILYSTFHHEHIATVWNKQREPFSVGGSSPGRALALAFLASKGVKL